MTLIIVIVSFVFILTVCYKYDQLEKKYKIMYNNYKTALKILGECDPKLKEYLEREDKNE